MFERRTDEVKAQGDSIKEAAGRAALSCPRGPIPQHCAASHVRRRALATGASWLCYFKALQDGPASVVVPIDKLSILVTIAFSYLVFHEKLTRRGALGLVGVTCGTLLMLV